MKLIFSEKRFVVLHNKPAIMHVHEGFENSGCTCFRINTIKHIIEVKVYFYSVKPVSMVNLINLEEIYRMYHAL